MIIYKATNKFNGKFYIGKTTKTLEQRWEWHLAKSKSGSQTYLHRAIRKYGADAFVLSVVRDNIPNSLLNEYEIHYISTLSPEYNMTKGGDGGDTSKSPNYIEGMKQRDYQGTNNPNYGKRGKANPKWGKKYGKKPNISEAKKQPVIADGQYFPSIGECEQALKIKWYYSSRKHPTRFYTVS